MTLNMQEQLIYGDLEKKLPFPDFQQPISYTLEEMGDNNLTFTKYGYSFPFFPQGLPIRVEAVREGIELVMGFCICLLE